MNLFLTNHAKDVCKRLGITEGYALSIVKNNDPHPSKSYPGQDRYCDGMYCVVVEKNLIITIYKDMVITPLRPDQLLKGVVIKRTR